MEQRHSLATFSGGSFPRLIFIGGKICGVGLRSTMRPFPKVMQGVKVAHDESEREEGRKGMYRIVLVILLVIMLAPPLYGQMLQVEKVGADSREVTLRDQETGKEWVVKVGDAIGVWRVMKIEPNGVTIAKWGDQDTIAFTKLPVKRLPGSVMPRPR